MIFVKIVWPLVSILISVFVIKFVYQRIRRTVRDDKFLRLEEAEEVIDEAREFGEAVAKEANDEELEGLLFGIDRARQRIDLAKDLEENQP
jgi:uncharacterized membrane protein